MVVRIKRDNQCKALRIASGTLENVSFYRYGLGVCVCVCAPAAQSCLTLCDPVDCSCQAPLSIGFSRQEHWSGVPFPSPGDLPNPGIEPRSPALQADSLPSEPPEMLWIHGPTEMIHSLMKYLLKAYYIQGICVNINKDIRCPYQKKTDTEELPFSAWRDKQAIILFWARA